MKNTIRIIALFVLLTSTGCKAQQLVQTPADAYKLKANEQLFLNRPLKNLLKEIKPEIKPAMGTVEYPSYLTFRFISREEMRKKPDSENTLGIFVYVKEPLAWKFDSRPKGKEYEWSKEDLEKYGSLTVTRIKVIGKE